MTAIKDGTGKGYFAKVNEKNRLSTISEGVSSGIQASLDKRGYLVRTDDVTLTSTSESHILYFKYTGENQIVIPKLYLTANQSTGGADGKLDFKFTKNPTTGTLITDETLAVLRNNNFAGTDTIAGTFYQGTEGSTITNGSDFSTSRLTAGTGFNIVSIEEEPWILETGNSVAVSVVPPSGNTSIIVRAGLGIYEFVE